MIANFPEAKPIPMIKANEYPKSTKLTTKPTRINNPSVKAVTP